MRRRLQWPTGEYLRRVMETEAFGFGITDASEALKADHRLSAPVLPFGGTERTAGFGRRRKPPNGDKWVASRIPPPIGLSGQATNWDNSFFSGPTQVRRDRYPVLQITRQEVEGALPGPHEAGGEDRVVDTACHYFSPS